MEIVNEKALDLLSQGEVLMSVENYLDAVEIFEEAVKESPKFIECYINLGNAYASIEDYDKAIDAYKKAMILDSNNVEVLFAMGNLTYLTGSLSDAIRFYNKAEETNEMTAEMYDVLADIFQSNDDYVQALRYINKAIQIEPLNGELYLEKVRIFINQQKSNEAIETLKDLNSVLPDAFEAYDMLAEIYIINDDYANAIDTAEKAVQRFPSDPDIASLKLKVLVKFNKDKEALNYIDTIKANGVYDERKEDNSLLEADILVRNNKLEEAAVCLESVANEHYENSQIAFVLINIYMTLHKFDLVEKITSYMLENDNDVFYDSTAIFYHAEALLKQDKVNEATKEMKDATKKLRNYTILDPSFYQGYIYRAILHKELKEYNEALRLTDYMESLFPERPDGYIVKYSIYLDQGNVNDAEQLKNKIKEIDPTFSI